MLDGVLVWPDAALSYPDSSLIRDRLYRVSRETQTEVLQLLVPENRRDELFQAAHGNPMAGHLGFAKTLDRMMACFYWLGI